MSLTVTPTAPFPTYVPVPSSFPNLTICRQKGFDMGPQPDPYALPLPHPVKGQQVYIADPLHFCINLPNPESPYLKAQYYSQGFAPSIVQGEGFVQSYCMGAYLPPGSLPLPQGGIMSAHVVKNFTTLGKRYWQISGRMDCGYLNVNCVGSQLGAYDDGGQYDSVPYRYCGKEPYSGVDATQHPGLTQYVEQAGDGIFCMRVCEGGTGLNDPCNAKNDTAGCYNTMGYVDRPGFTLTDVQTGQVKVFEVQLPPPSQTTLGPFFGDIGKSTMTTATATPVADNTASAVVTTAAGGDGSAPMTTAAARSAGFSLAVNVVERAWCLGGCLMIGLIFSTILP